MTARDPVRLDFLSWSEIRDSTPADPESESILSGYIVRGAVTLLSGKPKVGKSTLASAIAEAVDADAEDFLGCTVTGGPVVYLSEEGLATLAPKLPPSSRSVALTRDGAWPKPSWPELIEAAVAKATEIGAVLLVVDALAFWASFAEGSEKDSGAAQATMDALGAATAAGLAVLIVHHQRKSGGEDGDAIRGSGALLGSVDASMELERLGGRHRRLVALGRWPAPPVLVIDHDAETGGWRVVGRAGSREEAAQLNGDERILAALPDDAPGITEPDLVDVLGVHPREVAKPLRSLHGRGLSVRTGEGKRGDPYRYSKAPPKSSSESGVETVSLSPPPPSRRRRKETTPEEAPVPSGGESNGTGAGKPTPPDPLPFGAGVEEPNPSRNGKRDEAEQERIADDERREAWKRRHQ